MILKGHLVLLVGTLSLAFGCSGESKGAARGSQQGPGTTPDAGSQVTPGSGIDLPDSGVIPGSNGITPADCGSASTNGTNLGCEFYSTIPPLHWYGRANCHAAMIVNAASVPITMSASYDDRELDMTKIAWLPKGSGEQTTYEPLPNGELAPGQMAILFLAQFWDANVPLDPEEYMDDSGCPNDVYGIIPPLLKQTGRGRAFHIKTSAPAAAYDVFPYGGEGSGQTGATLLIPTSVWGKNYLVADTYQVDPNLNVDPNVPNPGSGDPFFHVVALEDETEVTINPTYRILAGSGVAGGPANNPLTYRLDRGELLQVWQSDALETFDGATRPPARQRRYAGSPITANKPIGVWGGAPGSHYNTTQDDSSHRQLPPVKSFGFEYAAVRHGDRAASDGSGDSAAWSLIGAVDNTLLAYDPAPPAGAPTSLNRGELAVFDTKEVFSVRSTDADHPFYLSNHMRAARAAWADTVKDRGEPESVNVLPPEQWLKSYVFMTDPTFRNTHLVFVRKQAEDGTFKDVTIACGGTLGGWSPVGTSGKYEFKRFDLITKGKPNGACNNGANSAESAAAFSLTVWGIGTEDAYAYPAGGAVKSINDVDVPAVPK